MSKQLRKRRSPPEFRKLRAAPLGKGALELDKFKEVWRNTNSEEFKKSWRDLLASRTHQKIIRAKLLAEHGVNLNDNVYITRLQDWIKKQDELDAERASQEAEEKQVKKDLGPNASLEEVRKEVLKRSYNRTLAKGDFKQGLATVREDVRVERLALDARKVELLEKKEASARG